MQKAIPHGTHSGYASRKCRCDLCSAAMRAYQLVYLAANKERVRARDRAYYELHREARIAQTRARYAATVEQQRVDARERYARNREARLAGVRAWQIANPKTRAFSKAKRKALLRSAESRVVTLRDWLKLCARYDYRCAYCGIRDVLTQEHVVPLSRGGRHSIGNLLPACISCNASKGAKYLTEWRLRR